MIRVMLLLLILTASTSCSEFALLTSGGSVAISHNAYAKAYSGMDFLTIINTEKDIKTHLYETIRHDDE
tara:strand:- start:282 stop:488 length:207 start_codon:yes stop_codon:yes gene_type:complete